MNQVPRDETVIRIDGVEIWQYTAIYPVPTPGLHRRLHPRRTTALTEVVPGGLLQNHDGDEAECLVNGAPGSRRHCPARTGNSATRHSSRTGNPETRPEKFGNGALRERDPSLRFRRARFVFRIMTIAIF